MGEKDEEEYKLFQLLHEGMPQTTTIQSVSERERASR